MLVTYVTKIAPFPSLIQLGNGANIKIPKQEISCTVHDRVVVLIMHSFLELTRRVSFLPSCTHIDGFQMSIKCPTSGGQARDQEAAVQRTFHFVRSSFFYLQTAIVMTQHSTY